MPVLQVSVSTLELAKVQLNFLASQQQLISILKKVVLVLKCDLSLIFNFKLKD